MNVKDTVQKLIKKHDTSNPFEIADNMKIHIIHEELGNTWGYFNEYKRCKMIHLNYNLEDYQKKFVCAHELGHVIYHPHVSTTFFKKNTFFCMSKIEKEANRFAIELLLPDTLFWENPDLTLYQVARMVGIPDKLAELKTF